MDDGVSKSDVSFLPFFIFCMLMIQYCLFKLFELPTTVKKNRPSHSHKSIMYTLWSKCKKTYHLHMHLKFTNHTQWKCKYAFKLQGEWGGLVGLWGSEKLHWVKLCSNYLFWLRIHLLVISSLINKKKEVVRIQNLEKCSDKKIANWRLKKKPG